MDIYRLLDNVSGEAELVKVTLKCLSLKKYPLLNFEILSSACFCIFEGLIVKSHQCCKIPNQSQSFQSLRIGIFTLTSVLLTNNVRKRGCDDHMCICVRGYFGIRWLHITHMVFGHTHMLWILSLFVSIVTQHVTTRVSDSLGTPDWKLPFSKTWLPMMNCDCTVNGLHEMLGNPLVYS